MDSSTISIFLLAIGTLLAATSLVAALLEKARIPSVIAALIVGVAARYTPLANVLAAPRVDDLGWLLAQLGVLFLLFFVGLQIDLRDVRESGREVLLLTALSTAVPFVLGTSLMLALGFDALRSMVAGMTLIPTAEVVVVPILDEFGLLHTRTGQLIVSAGTLDDIIEVAMVAAVSIWLGSQVVGATATGLLRLAAVGVLALIVLSYGAAHWVLPHFARCMPNHPHHLVMLSTSVLLVFVSLTTFVGLGSLIGAIAAGMIMRATYSRLGSVGEQATNAFRDIAYGFFGALFFARVGLSLDLVQLVRSPWLALSLLMAGACGKIGGMMILRAAKKLSTREAVTIGVGLEARLTSETIVAQMLFQANLISASLFGALVAASALSTLGVPVVLAQLARKWSETLRTPLSAVPEGG